MISAEKEENSIWLIMYASPRNHELEPYPYNITSVSELLKRKRKARAIKACFPCRHRKVKCDGNQPCTSCVTRTHPDLFRVAPSTDLNIVRLLFEEYSKMTAMPPGTTVTWISNQFGGNIPGIPLASRSLRGSGFGDGDRRYQVTVNNKALHGKTVYLTDARKVGIMLRDKRRTLRNHSAVTEFIAEADGNDLLLRAATFKENGYVRVGNKGAFHADASKNDAQRSDIQLTELGEELFIDGQRPSVFDDYFDVSVEALKEGLSSLLILVHSEGLEKIWSNPIIVVNNAQGGGGGGGGGPSWLGNWLI